MKIATRIKALFFSLLGHQKKEMAQLKKALSSLQKDVENLENQPNKVEALIKLFQIISPLYDEGGFSALIAKLERVNYGQFTKTIELLNILQKHVENAGRNPYGINRTKKGEVVTAANVYLGDVFGIWTKSASYWLEKQEELKKDLRLDISKDQSNPVTTWYCINDYQAGGFLKSHTKGILQTISDLKKVA